MLSDIVRMLIFLVALAQGASLPGEATEELLGELPEGSRVNQVTMAVSAAGYHVAWVGKQGLAPSVFVNGRPVPGPTVEDIGDIALNSLGDHVAWTESGARAGSRFSMGNLSGPSSAQSNIWLSRLMGDSRSSPDASTRHTF